jgi:hypothetical protein
VCQAGRCGGPSERARPWLTPVLKGAPVPGSYGSEVLGVSSFIAAMCIGVHVVHPEGFSPA